jgi:hypothetical protein
MSRGRIRELAGERRLGCTAKSRGRYQGTSGGHDKPRVSEATRFFLRHTPFDSHAVLDCSSLSGSPSIRAAGTAALAPMLRNS